MEFQRCPNCEKDTGHKRAFGAGTIIVTIITCGLWVLVMPFYPMRCIVCGREVEKIRTERDLTLHEAFIAGSALLATLAGVAIVYYVHIYFLPHVPLIGRVFFPLMYFVYTIVLLIESKTFGDLLKKFLLSLLVALFGFFCLLCLRWLFALIP